MSFYYWNKLNFIPFFFLIIAVLCWAGNFVLGKAVTYNILPVTLNFWRWTIAAIILFPFVIKDAWKAKEIICNNWLLLIILSITGIATFHTCVYLALCSTTAINAGLLMAMVPFVVPIFSFATRLEKLASRQICGIVLSFIGVLGIISQFNLANIKNFNLAKGDIWMFIAVLLWSIYTVALKQKPIELKPIIMLFVITIAGVVMLLPFYIVELIISGGFEINFVNLLSIGYVAIFASIIAFVCWNKAVFLIGPNIAGLFIHLLPVFSTFLAIVFLKEKFQIYHILGFIFILSGIYLTVIGVLPANLRNKNNSIN